MGAACWPAWCSWTPLRKAGWCLLVAAWGGVVQAACPSTQGQVEAQASAAAVSFSRMDTTGFDASRDAMREGVACLLERPSAATAAAVHLAEALAWFQVNDRARTLASIQAMVESDPEATLSGALAPTGGQLRLWFDEARARPPAARAPVTLPAGWSLVVDGEAAAGIPSDRPAVVVVLRENGQVWWSGLLPAGGAVPTPPVSEPCLSCVEIQPEPDRR